MTDAAQVIQDMSAEVSALAEAFEGFLQRFELLLSLPDALVKLGEVHIEGGATTGAVDVRLSLQASDGALRLVTALRAGNVQLGAINAQIDHVVRSLGGASVTEGFPSPSVKPFSHDGGEPR